VLRLPSLTSLHKRATRRSLKSVEPVSRRHCRTRLTPSFTLSEPKPVSHRQLNELVKQITSALLYLGVTSSTAPIAERPRASIYADTSMNWQLLSQAFARLGMPITTAYTTLGEEGLETSLVEPDVGVVFCGPDQVSMVAKVLPRAEKVKWVVYDGEARADQVHLQLVSIVWLADRQAALAAIGDVLGTRKGQVIPLSRLLEMGNANPAEDLGPKPQPSDLFCIMYTSGSTGPPKGVLLTHGNVIASLAGSTMLYGKYFDPKTDLLLAYLPLAHILEQFLEFTFYLLGVQVGYATVKTLLDDSVRNCRGDFAAYKPVGRLRDPAETIAYGRP